MSTAQVLGLFALLLYGVATLFSVLRLLGRETVSKSIFLIVSSLALVCHTMGLQQLIFTPTGVNLGFYPIASLIGALIVFISIATSIMRPLENITVAIYPLALVAVLLSMVFSSSYEPRLDLSAEITGHILLSILAYALLAVSAGQSLLIAAQNYQLKSKRTSGIVQVLPPLQTMESILFEIIWIGVVTLSLSIVTGFLFLDDIFEQHLAHKIFFTVLAWCVFVVLLWGRHRVGWRGVTAIRWTLSGFGLLVVGFFGSKLMLEIILAQ